MVFDWNERGIGSIPTLDLSYIVIQDTERLTEIIL